VSRGGYSRIEMSRTVSFVARDELADWLEQRAEDRMKSISAVCQDIVAAEYRRQRDDDGAKGGSSPQDTDKSGDDDGPEPLQSEQRFSFATKREADGVRTQFTEFLSENDDRRLKKVTFEEGTPGDVVAEIRRRAE
jgi:hypothetical protein